MVIKMKRYLIACITFCLLITSINVIDSNKIYASNKNKTEHYDASRARNVNDIKQQEIINQVTINEEDVSKKENKVKEIKNEVTNINDEVKQEDVKLDFVDAIKSLEDEGYVLDKENSQENIKVLKKDNTIKLLSYNKEDLVKSKNSPQALINESNPYKYEHDGVKLEYFIKDKTLTFDKEENGKLIYNSNDNFTTEVTMNKGSTIFSHRINDKDVEIINSYKITSEHQFKIDETDDGTVLNIYDNSDNLTTSFYVVSTLDYLLNQDGQVQNDFSNYEYQINEETNMVEIKVLFDEKISEDISDEPAYVVQMATFNGVVGTTDRFLRGTRQNGPDYAYPYIAGSSDIAMGGAGEPFKVRIGKNVESFVGGFSSLNAGYYEDKTNYADVINSLNVKTRLVGADLKMFLVGPPKGTGGYLTNKEFFELNCSLSGSYCNVPEYAKSGTYMINAMYGGYNPRTISYNNMINWDSTGAISYQSSGINRTTIGYDHPTSTWVGFDVSHAVGAWLRNGNVSQQMLQITNYGPDNYFATSALASGQYAPYIEMTLEEIPDFEANPYPMSNTKVNVRSFTKNDHRGAVTNVAIGIDGLTTMGAKVKYEVYEKETNKVVQNGETNFEAKNTYAFPMYLTDIQQINNYYLMESNYQVEQLLSTQDLDINKVYGVRVMPYFKNGNGEEVTDKGDKIDISDKKFWYEGDTFQLYKVGYKYEVLDRILNFYGRNTKELRDVSYFDNNMHNHLISENNKLFIRNPSENAGKAYVASELGENEKYLIDQGLMGMGYKCEFGFEPINFNTGNFVYNNVDAVVNSKGEAIEFTRYYNAMEDAAPSSFGRNWSSTIDYRMQILNNGTVMFKDETGTGHVMTKNSDETYNASYTGYTYRQEVASVEDKLVDSGYYAAPRGENAIQSTIQVTHYNHVFTSQNGDSFYFNDDLKLEKVVKNNGELHTFINGFYGVEKYILPDGKEINFEYNKTGFVNKIIYDDGTFTSYTYDSKGNLTSFTDQKGVIVEYNYNSSNGDYLMTSYESNGVVFIENEYDELKRVVEQTDSKGNISTLAYHNGYTALTDNNGNEFEVYYNELGHTTKVVNNGLVEENIYNDKMQVIAKNEIDKDGNKLTTNFEYNEIGQVIKVIYPTGEIASFEYDGYNLINTTTPSGAVSYNYDANNNLISSTKNGMPLSSDIYDNNNNLISQTNEYGGVTSFTYYPDGNIKTVTSPLGNTVTYEYDSLGFMSKKITELGETITYKTSKRGELLKSTYSDGTFELYEYDDFGRMIAKKDRDGVIFNYKYDSLNNLIETITPYFSIKYEYDANNNLIKEIDGNGNVTSFEYNEKNQIVKKILPSGLEEEMEINEEGLLISRKDSLGILEENNYDKFNRLITKDSLGNNLNNIYSKNKLIASFNNDILQQAYVYNEYGETVKNITNTGVENISTKDSLGHILSSSDGSNTIEYQYDLIGNVINTTNVYGFVVNTQYGPYNLVLNTTNEDGIKKDYTYDINGNKTSTIVDGVVTEKIEYTPAGRIKTKSDGNLNKSTYVYDELGRIDYIIQPNGGIVDYKLDNNGNIIEYIDPNNNITKFEYDNMNRKIKTINALGYINETVYDLRGNIVQETREDGKSKTFKYNSNNQLIKETDYNGVTTENVYNKQNKLIEQLKSTGEKTTYTYDKYGRTISTTSFSKTAKDTYDKYNRVTHKTLIDNRQTYSEYDLLGRVLKSVNEYGETIVNEYTPSGQLSKIIYEDGTFEEFEYDSLYRTIKTIDRLGNISSSTYDNNGNILTNTNALGNTVSFEYNNMNNVIKETDALGNITTYEYDIVGNEFSKTDALGNKTTKSYDSLNRIVSEVDALNYETIIEYNELNQVKNITRKDGIIESYKYDISGNEIENKVGDIVVSRKVYDLNGNVIKEEDANGNNTLHEYDVESNLIKTIKPNGNVISYKYDKFGYLTSTSDKVGVIEKNVYDKHHRLIKKTDNNGNIQRYFYEKKGENLIEEITPTNHSIFYEYDVLDRIVKTVNEKGVETTSEYDRIGNVTNQLTSQGKVSNEYDANSNLISVEDALGVKTTYKYDALNREIEFIDGNGNVNSKDYDELGRVSHKKLNDKVVKQVEYNPLTILSETDAVGNKIQYQYDMFGNIIKAKQNDDLITLYDYDKNGNITRVNKSKNTIQEYKYDESNNKIYFRNAQSITHKYEYDVRNRMTTEINNDGTSIKYTYDQYDNLIKETAGNETRKISYNRLGSIESTKYSTKEKTFNTMIKYDEYNRMNEVTDPNNNTIKYQYDKYDRRTNLTYSDGTIQNYQYNEKGILDKTITREGIEVKFSYDNNYNITKEEYSNGIKSEFEYNEQNLQTNIQYSKDNIIVEKDTYKYDDIGRIVVNNREVEGKKIKKSYKYDELNQLSYAEYNVEDGMASSNIIYEYEYDKLSNRNLEKITTNGKQEVYEEKTNKLGQVISRIGNDEEINYKYDSNGNLVEEISKDDKIEYKYNNFGLLSQTTKDNLKFEEFQYDGFGNRIGKITYDYYNTQRNSAREGVSSLEVTLKNTIENNNELKCKSELTTLEEGLKAPKECRQSENVLNSNKTKTEYINDIGVENALVLEIKEEVDIYNTFAYQKPIVSTLDNETEINVLSTSNSINARIGKEVSVHEYAPNGKELAVANDFEIINELGYNGEVEDNLDLQYLRARYYKQDTARFISEDNFRGEVGRGQSHNSYIYTENNPVNYVDRDGEKATTFGPSNVVYKGFGYQIVHSSPGFVKIKIDNKGGDNAGIHSYINAQKWLKKNGYIETGGGNYTKKSTEQYATDLLAGQNNLNHKPGYYTGTYELDPWDVKFVEKVIMCDKLENKGLTTEQVKYAIHNYSLEQLENFLYNNSKYGTTWKEWQENQDRWVSNGDIRNILKWMSTLSAVLGILPHPIGTIFDLVSIVSDFLLEDWFGVVVGCICLIIPMVKTSFSGMLDALKPKGVYKMEAAVKTLAENSASASNHVISMIDDVTNALNGWNPGYLKSLKNGLFEAATLFKKLLSGLGSTFRNYISKETDSIVKNIFSKNNDGFIKILKNVCNDMANPNKYQNIGNAWNKFQKLFSDYGGYEFIKKYDGWFSDELITDIFAACKFKQIANAFIYENIPDVIGVALKKIKERAFA